MENTDIYHTLAQSIADSAKGEWKEAVLKLMVVPKTVEYNLNFIDGLGNAKSVKFVRPSNLTEQLLNFQRISTEGERNRWNRAIFKLWPGGKFDMEFIWDQKLYDEIERLNKT